LKLGLHTAALSDAACRNLGVPLPVHRGAGEYCMSRPWPQERNMSLIFALQFLHEPQS